MLTAIAEGGSAWVGVVTAALQGAAVLIALASSDVPRWIWMGLLVPVAVSVLGAATSTSSSVHGALAIVNAAILGALPIIIAIRFRRNPYINVQSVLGAVSVYLVIGIIFSAVDSGVSQLLARPFFADSSAGSRSDFVYFSFITLTTVGYGDLVPAGGLARSAAVGEALIGQLYLVTVVSLLVGNFGRVRDLPSRGANPGAQASDLSRPAGSARGGASGAPYGERGTADRA